MGSWATPHGWIVRQFQSVTPLPRKLGISRHKAATKPLLAETRNATECCRRTSCRRHFLSLTVLPGEHPSHHAIR